MLRVMNENELQNENGGWKKKVPMFYGNSFVGLRDVEHDSGIIKFQYNWTTDRYDPFYEDIKVNGEKWW